MERTLLKVHKSGLTIKELFVKLSVVLLFLSIVANSVFGEDANYYVISKFVIFAFMGVSAAALLFGMKKHFSMPVVLLILNFYWFFFATLWAPSSSWGMQQLTTMVQILIMAFLVYEVVAATEEYEMFFKALFYSGLALLVFSLYTYGFSGLIEQMEGGTRVGGEIANENTFGLVFSYACVCGFYFAFFKSKYLYLLGSAAFIFFAFSSGSKKALFTIAFGIIFMLVFKYGIKRFYKVIIIGAICAAVLLYLLSLPIFSVLAERVTSFFSGEKNLSDSIRADLIKAGWQMFLQKPVFGYGAEGFRMLSGYGNYSHNNFIELLVNYGLVGFLLYYSMTGYILYRLYYGVRRKNPECLMMVILIIVRLIMDYAMVSYSTKGAWFFLGVGLAMAVNEKKAVKRGLLK